jgi:phosphoserine phosphatase RsbU/P
VLALAGQRLWRPAEERIDRAFFRNAYDARRILERVGVESRVATDRHALASLLERALEDALHPCALYVYLRQPGPPARLIAAGDDAEALAAMPLGLDTPAARELERRAQPVVLDDEDLAAGRPFAEYAALVPELVVPMLGRGGQLEGLLVLGPRLSEEPYSGEDRALLASAAAQAGLALENIRLAERMALQLEAERRQARELEIAKAVQAKLLPQHAPTLATLEYAGVCVQAREVGGDYYDFMPAGAGRLALVLADISGKGMSAALLMASLQASLRAQYMLAPDDLRAVLRSVNRIFYESTATNHYATLFFAVYDGGTRRLQYANCGHLPPMLLRRSGALERLGTTAAVVGLFEPWGCDTAETLLEPGDLLLVFTDGATDATSPTGEEFGETRLLDLVVQHRDAPPADLLAGIFDAVTRHGGPLQFDDLTLIAARAS